MSDGSGESPELLQWEWWIGRIGLGPWAMITSPISNLQLQWTAGVRENEETDNGRILLREQSQNLFDPFHLRRILSCPQLGVTLALWDWCSAGKPWANRGGVTDEMKDRVRHTFDGSS